MWSATTRSDRSGRVAVEVPGHFAEPHCRVLRGASIVGADRRGGRQPSRVLKACPEHIGDAGVAAAATTLVSQ
jgi:hypothetical protein